MFRWSLLFLLASSVSPASGDAIVLYASPDGKTGGWWGDNPVGRADGTVAELATRYPRKGNEIEIRLLTQGPGPWEPTDYPGPFVLRSPAAAADWLTIRGQRKNENRYTRIVGKSLQDSVCDPVPDGPRRELCRRGQIDPKVPRRMASPTDLPTAMLQAASLTAAKIETHGFRKENPDYSIFGPGVQRYRLNCISVWNSNYITFKDLAFRDCWLPSILVTDSTHIRLHGAHIEGSSYAFLAVATANTPSRARGFEIVDTVYVQSPGRYKPRTGCDPRHDLNCAADIWSEIPWAVVHDRFWEMLNGALMGGIDIAGDVLLQGNQVSHAYNGIRLILSDGCGSGCREHTNTNVTIVDNDFAYIRDNPIEPEEHAKRWIIARNRIWNSHAWISMDKVRGTHIYVYGNRGWFQDGGDGNRSAALPSLDCEDHGWEKSPRFHFDRPGGYEGYYEPLPDPDDPYDPACDAGRGGRVFKVKAKPGRRLDAVYVFNNSWRLRAPVIARLKSSPLRHWNNAIEFAGCGLKGDPVCRIVPWDDCNADDGEENHFTPDNRSLFAGCFNFDPVAGAQAHRFDFDAVSGRMPEVLKNRGLETNGQELNGAPMFMGSGQGDFTPASDKLRNTGCRVEVDGPELKCDPANPNRPYIGAIQAGGALFDFVVP